MATELENASLKVVLDLQEARAAVDEIDQEQQRRRGAGPGGPEAPGIHPPDETPVTRPNAGRSAATGEPEVAPTAPAEADARPPKERKPRSPDTPEDDEPEASHGNAGRAALVWAKKLGGFAMNPSGTGAVHLGGEIAREGGVAAERAGLAGAAGTGIALAGAAAAVVTGFQYAPRLTGILEGLGASRGIAEAIIGPVSYPGFRAAAHEAAAFIMARSDAEADLADVAFAQMRTGRKPDGRFRADHRGAIVGLHEQIRNEDALRDDMQDRLRTKAATEAILDGFQRGNK